jgi:UDP-3-O-[3-hydroxymyristoyl] N-acetylglucosamine deacetylase
VLRQRTLRSAVETHGIGLHTGDEVQLRLCPALPRQGVVFRRVDVHPPVDIAACVANVSGTTLSTTLAGGGYTVSTVEHLLAALAGLGVDNVIIEVSAPEVPIMDGSAGPFVNLIQKAGLVEQDAPKRLLRVKREIRVEEGDKTAIFLPFDGFKVSFTIDFDQPVFRQCTATAEMDFSRHSFVEEVSRARTFGFIHQLEYLRSQGFARGGSFDNAVVVDEYRVLNREGLRSEDEFVKHKVLDAIGDLYLLGGNLLGEFRAHKSGHTLNNRALRALLEHSDAWEWMQCDDSASAALAGKFLPQIQSE